MAGPALPAPPAWVVDRRGLCTSFASGALRSRDRLTLSSSRCGLVAGAPCRRNVNFSSVFVPSSKRGLGRGAQSLLVLDGPCFRRHIGDGCKRRDGGGAFQGSGKCSQSSTELVGAKGSGGPQ